ncbi:unnamed protein product [Ambrosiozyma monospora]|uniref:Unnamed protein product n=1 Tax=Ambrosiozyma monospora TaxID=43982 RepID=A0A9W6Z563_AMBMO|nr:unnamed protein product [Ambrosiozyma monospora]
MSQEILSIVSFLDDPNINSPANVDASNKFRDDKDGYKVKVLQDVERSKKDIPADFKIPDLNPPKYDDDYDKDWYDNYDEVDEDDYDEYEEDDEDEDASFIEDEEVEMSEDYGEDNSK